MADNSSPTTAFIGSATSVCSIFFAWITIHNAQVILAFITSGVGILSGIFAARYYWIAAKEKKANLKNLKQ